MYQKVVNDVVDGVREAFLDEGCDEQVLHELKQVCLAYIYVTNWRVIIIQCCYRLLLLPTAFIVLPICLASNMEVERANLIWHSSLV
jgi:hypothetical protein